MKWIMRWGYEMAATPTRPGIYRLKSGGHFVRGRVTDLEKRRHEVTAVLPGVTTAAEAQRRLDELVAERRAEVRGEGLARTTWRSFAVSRLAERKERGKVVSEATIERWTDAIGIFDAEWGNLDVLAVTTAHIDRWLSTKVATWMREGRTTERKRRVDGKLVMVPFTTKLKPTTVNGWLRVLRAICHAVKVKFKLPTSAFEGIEFFEEGRIYTRERPNALNQAQLGQFMRIARARFPQHFAMMLLGFVTGLRPSSLRPLRWRGTESDIDWESGLLLVRRSHSRGQVVMDKTKTGKDNEITLPESVLAVLKEHVATLENVASDLLFPGKRGALLTRNILAKPFAAIVAAMELPFRLTPRGMRRSFNDIARQIGINDIVTRSISGHQTESMQRHYSTAADAEQRAAVERVHAAAEGKAAS